MGYGDIVVVFLRDDDDDDDFVVDALSTTAGRDCVSPIVYNRQLPYRQKDYLYYYDTKIDCSDCIRNAPDSCDLVVTS